jgi:hypothetical protein
MDAAETVIACDESGAEGENVYASEHRVFVHASVDLTLDEAAGVIAEVQRLAPTQASEYKSRQLLRPSGQKALDWLLAEDGVLVGRARAFVVDKDYFVVAKIVDMLIEEVTHESGDDLYANDQARTFAWTLYRQGQRALGTADWSALVAGFNSLMRSKQRKSVKTSVEEFFTVVDRVRLRSHRRDVEVEEVLALLWRARPHADIFQDDLADVPDQLPSLDPLIAAIPQTARSWYEISGRPVRLVHDRQAVLTPGRVAAMINILAHPPPEFAHFVPPVDVVAIDQVDSQDDPRVQVADLLAGAARQIAANALAGKRDDRVALLSPFVVLDSVWADDVSWTALTGRDAVGR